MRASAALLSSSRSIVGLAELVRAAGFASASIDLDAATRQTLRLDGVRRAELAAGAGAIRILLLELSDEVPLRDSLQRLSRRLSSRAPHVLWIVAAVDARGRNAAIVGWAGGDGAHRVASFLWETDRVVDSDAETLCALAAVCADDDLLRHARYVEVLGRSEER